MKRLLAVAALGATFLPAATQADTPPSPQFMVTLGRYCTEPTRESAVFWTVKSDRDTTVVVELNGHNVYAGPIDPSNPQRGIFTGVDRTQVELRLGDTGVVKTKTFLECS